MEYTTNTYGIRMGKYLFSGNLQKCVVPKRMQKLRMRMHSYEENKLNTHTR